MVGEDVVYWGEEGADDHESYAGVIQPPEEVVEASGMATEEVGYSAEDQTAHCSTQEYKPWPYGE